MSNEFVMVPRCTLENVLKDGSLKAEVHASFVKAQQDIRTLLSQPAEQHQGEPVACATIKMRMVNGRLCATVERFDSGQFTLGELTEVFTHADPGEVERLRYVLGIARKERDTFSKNADDLYRRAQNAELAMKVQTQSCDTLRAQLAERDALISELEDDRLRMQEGLKDVIDWIGCSQSTGALRAIAEKALSAGAEPSAPKCKTCNGTGMVDDGEITCSEGGIPYENGPVKCVKDCPDCAPVERDERAAFAERCDGKEQEAFEAWAKGQNYDLACHPLHWLFLDAKTYAARKGWAAGLEYATGVARAALERKPS